MKNVWRGAASSAVLFAVVTVAACATGPRAYTIDGLAPTAYGSFLAAQYAGIIQESEAEAAFYRDAISRAGEDPVLVEHAFISALSNGDVAEAEALARDALDVVPGDRVARLVLAGAAVRDGRHRRAIALLEDVDLGPFNRAVGAMILAWAHTGAGDLNAALAALDQRGAQPMLGQLSTLHRALVLDYAQKPRLAESAYRKALASGAMRPLAVDAYGRFLEIQGRRQAALDLYAARLMEDPQDPAALGGAARLERGETAKPLAATPAEGASLAVFTPAAAVASQPYPDLALLYLRLALAIDESNVAARVFLSESLARAGRDEDALKVASLDHSHRPGGGYDAALRISRAWTLARMDRLDDAIAVMEDGLKDGDRRVRLSLGDLYAAAERPEDAEAVYTSLIDSAEGHRPEDDAAAAALGPPTHAQSHPDADEADKGDLWIAYYARGAIREQMGVWRAAESDFLQALALAPDNPTVLNHLGYSWVDRGEHVERAFAMIRRAADLRPDAGHIIDSLGWAYFRLGDYEASVQALEAAAQLSPHDPLINDHLGDAYWRVGRRLEANFQWTRVLSLEPDAEMTQRVERKLAQGLPPETEQVAAKP